MLCNRNYPFLWILLLVRWAEKNDFTMDMKATNQCKAGMWILTKQTLSLCFESTQGECSVGLNLWTIAVLTVNYIALEYCILLFFTVLIVTTLFCWKVTEQNRSLLIGHCTTAPANRIKTLVPQILLFLHLIELCTNEMYKNKRFLMCVPEC